MGGGREERGAEEKREGGAEGEGKRGGSRGEKREGRGDKREERDECFIFRRMWHVAMILALVECREVLWYVWCMGLLGTQSSVC